MVEQEKLSAALRKMDLATHAYELVSRRLAETASFTPQSAGQTATKFIFYRLHAEQETKTYQRTVSGEYPDEPSDEAKNGSYQRIRGYLKEFLNRQASSLDPQFVTNTRAMIAAIPNFGEPFQEPLLPYQDPAIIESFEKIRPLPKNPVKLPNTD